MNLLVLEEKERIEENLFRLGKRKSIHILEILKKKPGDKIKAGLIRKSFGEFLIESIDEDKTILGKFISHSDKSTNTNDLIIISALQRPQTTKKIFQLSATTGARLLIFFPADKSEKSYLNSPVWRENEIEDEMILGLEQGKKIFPPEVRLFHNKRDALHEIPEHYFRIILEETGIKIEKLGSKLKEYKDIIIALGSESGWSEEDLDIFKNKNFTPVSISNHTLRSEFALAYALSALEILTRS